MISFGPTWTLTPIIRRFNNHQEVEYHEEGSENSGQNVGKNMGIRSGRRGIRKWGGSPWGPRKRAQKNLKKVL